MACEKSSTLRARAFFALGILLFLAAQYAMALWRLRSGGVGSKFARVAMDDYRGFVIGQNLHVLLAYGLLGLAAWAILYPLGEKLRHRCSRPVVSLGAGLFGAMALHGFFMFRLAYSRPYFTGDAAFGDWYYRLLHLPPESWQGAVHHAIFKLMPALVALAVIGWWFWRSRTRGRLLLSGMLLLAATSGYILQHRLRPSALRVAESGERPLNVLVIGSDSLRGDALGYAGYRPPRGDGPAAAGVTPRIDRWARDAVIFDNCRTPIASTLESGVSMMTSTYPHTHGLRQMFATRDEIERVNHRETSLAKLLATHGYDTAAIGDWCAGYYHLTPLGFEDIDVSNFDNFEIYMSQAVLMSHFVVPLYFDHALGQLLFPQIRSFAQFVTPEVVTSRVVQRLRRRDPRGRPFFWHVFYSCNHLPFRSKRPYHDMFSDPDYDGPHATAVDFDINAFIGGTDVESKWLAMPRQDARQIRALYDGCTRQFDDNFGEVIQALRDAGEFERTVVVLVSDHGEDLYGPGLTLGHGLSFNGSDPSFRIPLAMSVPGHSGQRISAPVRNLDVAPTLVGLLGQKAPERWEGADLSPWIRGESRPRILPAYAETQFPFIQVNVPGIERDKLPPMDRMTRVDPDFDHQFVLRPEYRERVIRAKQRCLWTRDWKLVATPDVEGRRHYQLFHIATDPHSSHDLATGRPEVLEPMRAALEQWMDDRRESAIDEIFPDGEPPALR